MPWVQYEVFHGVSCKVADEATDKNRRLHVPKAAEKRERVCFAGGMYTSGHRLQAHLGPLPN